MFSTSMKAITIATILSLSLFGNVIAKKCPFRGIGPAISAGAIDCSNKKPTEPTDQCDIKFFYCPNPITTPPAEPNDAQLLSEAQVDGLVPDIPRDSFHTSYDKSLAKQDKRAILNGNGYTYYRCNNSHPTYYATFMTLSYTTPAFGDKIPQKEVVKKNVTVWNLAWEEEWNILGQYDQYHVKAIPVKGTHYKGVHHYRQLPEVLFSVEQQDSNQIKDSNKLNMTYKRSYSFGVDTLGTPHFFRRKFVKGGLSPKAELCISNAQAAKVYKVAVAAEWDIY